MLDVTFTPFSYFILYTRVTELHFKQALNQEHIGNSLKSLYINNVCIMYDNFPAASRQRGYAAAAAWFSIDTGGLLPGIPVQYQPTCCGNANVPNDRERVDKRLRKMEGVLGPQEVIKKHQY